MPASCEATFWESDKSRLCLLGADSLAGKIDALVETGNGPDGERVGTVDVEETRGRECGIGAGTCCVRRGAQIKKGRKEKSVQNEGIA